MRYTNSRFTYLLITYDGYHNKGTLENL